MRDDYDEISYFEVMYSSVGIFAIHIALPENVLLGINRARVNLFESQPMPSYLRKN